MPWACCHLCNVSLCQHVYSHLEYRLRQALSTTLEASGLDMQACLDISMPQAASQA